MSEASSTELWRIWDSAAKAPTIDAEVRALYADLDREVAAGGAVCQASGRCCRFDEFGHRLYVTGLEIAWVLAERAKGQGGRVKVDVAAAPTGGCPFQVGRLCSIHTIRPLGCRVFFCQAGTEQWQRELYERFLGRLRALHDAHGLPYRYMEWRAGLAEVVATADA